MKLLHYTVSFINYFARGSGGEVLWWAWLCVCLPVCLCVSVCPPWYLQNQICNLYQFFCVCWLWPWPVLLGLSYKIPRGRGSFGGFLPHWQCIEQHSIWDPYKNGWTDRHAVWHYGWALPDEQYDTWVDNLQRKGQFWGKTCLTSLTPLLVVIATSTKDRFHLNLLIYC